MVPFLKALNNRWKSHFKQAHQYLRFNIQWCDIHYFCQCGALVILQAESCSVQVYIQSIFITLDMYPMQVWRKQTKPLLTFMLYIHLDTIKVKHEKIDTEKEHRVHSEVFSVSNIFSHWWNIFDVTAKRFSSKTESGISFFFFFKCSVYSVHTCMLIITWWKLFSY